MKKKGKVCGWSCLLQCRTPLPTCRSNGRLRDAEPDQLIQLIVIDIIEDYEILKVTVSKI